jgi:hypothetical protein
LFDCCIVAPPLPPPLSHRCCCQLSSLSSSSSSSSSASCVIDCCLGVTSIDWADSRLVVVSPHPLDPSPPPSPVNLDDSNNDPLISDAPNELIVGAADIQNTCAVASSDTSGGGEELWWASRGFSSANSGNKCRFMASPCSRKNLLSRCL